MAILTVGPGQQFASVSAAVAASHNGDRIYVAAGTYLDDFATISTRIKIIGVGGMVHFVADKLIPNGKAFLVTNTDVTLDHLEFSGAAVTDGNGAGVRYQGGNLTITNCWFHDNQEGLLGNVVAGGTITIDASEFARNGAGDGFTHNIYVNRIASLKITNSYLHEANVGHELKSRADATIVVNSRIFDLNSTASYSIDLPNGGNATIQNNIIQQGPSSLNTTIISYAAESAPYLGSALLVLGNTIVNQSTAASARGVFNHSSLIAEIDSNHIYGLTEAQIASGPNAKNGNDFLSDLPPLDTSHPFAASPWDALVSGGAAGDVLSGSAARDLIVGGGGDDTLTGGDGIDTAAFAGIRSSYALAYSKTAVTVFGPDGSDTLYGIEKALFDDQSVLLAAKAARADFNADYDADLLTQNTDGRAAITLMNGTAVLSSSSVGPNPGPQWHAKAAADFDGDGRADILWQNDSGLIALWFMDGMTLLSGGNPPIDPGSAWHAVAAGDFNADGYADILWQNTDGTPAIWLMNGTNLLSGAALSNPGPSWHVIAAADFNGDGKSDILWQHSDGTAAIWRMDGTSFVTGTGLSPSPGTAWHVKTAADFDADGKSDIVWQNDDGTPVIWFMDGTTLRAGAVAAFNPGSSWRVAGAGDLNADGYADLIWQHADGTLAVWLMSGAALLSGAAFVNPGSDWHIIAMGS